MVRNLLTIPVRKRDLKKALATASWARCFPDPCGKTKYINLCQINRKASFQPSVCTPSSYFILCNKTIVEYSGKYVCHDWLAKFVKWTCPLFICHEFASVKIPFIAHRRVAGAHGLGQGINHLITETEILFLVRCSI